MPSLVDEGFLVGSRQRLLQAIVSWGFNFILVTTVEYDTETEYIVRLLIYLPNHLLFWCCRI